MKEPPSLPTTNTQNVAAKANQLANFPLNFLRTGYYRSTYGQNDLRRVSGYWWVATRSSTAYTNGLHTNTSNVDPQYSIDRGFGFALRCGARE